MCLCIYKYVQYRHVYTCMSLYVCICLYKSVYVCICICLYMYIWYMYINACVGLWLSISLSLSLPLFTCIYIYTQYIWVEMIVICHLYHIYIYISIYVCMCLDVPKCLYVSVHIYIHTFIYTYIYTYIYIYVSKYSGSFPDPQRPCLKVGYGSLQGVSIALETISVNVHPRQNQWAVENNSHELGTAPNFWTSKHERKIWVWFSLWAMPNSCLADSKVLLGFAFRFIDFWAN